MLGIGRRVRRTVSGSGLSLIAGGPEVPDNFSMLPHRVTSYRRPAFWNPVQRFKRAEFLVGAPNLPGTAIRWTLFHPTYIPGLQGFGEVLPWNFAWAWGRNNFERFASLQYRLANPAGSPKAPTSRTASWIPQMQAQPYWNAQVYQQPRPSYQPIIVNPQGSGGSGDRRRRNG